MSPDAGRRKTRKARKSPEPNGAGSSPTSSPLPHPELTVQQRQHLRERRSVPLISLDCFFFYQVFLSVYLYLLFSRLPPYLTGFYWFFLGFTGFFSGFYWVLLGFTGFHWVLLGFTGFYYVLLGLTGFYLV